ncbi:MAG: cation diffusion facilitator family transporter [Candidatus Bipolaricaulota bacterium]|nr:cation diffusion facilitator family transporter [Candidatus Bipolaricaulota bacterium]
MSRPEASQGQPRDFGVVVVLGLCANIILALVKTTIGILGHSQALLADGINSTSDVVYYTVVALFMRMARKPPDEEHPYGHRQLESVAALVVGAFVITTAIAIFWDSANSTFDLLSGAKVAPIVAWISLFVAVGTVLVKTGLTLYTYRVAKRTGNVAMRALAADHRNDILSAGAASVGILLGRIGYPWVDPFAGAVVALFVLRTGIGIVRDTTADLMDTTLTRSVRKEIEDIARSIDGVCGVDGIRANRFGPFLVLNLTIVVDGTQSVDAGDDIATAVENAVTERMSLVREVHVHYHPENHQHH